MPVLSKPDNNEWKKTKVLKKEERGKYLNEFTENGRFFLTESKIFRKLGNLKKKKYVQLFPD